MPDGVLFIFLVATYNLGPSNSFETELYIKPVGKNKNSLIQWFINILICIYNKTILNVMAELYKCTTVLV